MDKHVVVVDREGVKKACAGTVCGKKSVMSMN